MMFKIGSRLKTMIPTQQALAILSQYYRRVVPQILCIKIVKELKASLSPTNLMSQQINYLASLNLFFSGKIKIPAISSSDSCEEQMRWNMTILCSLIPHKVEYS